jgi:DNA mismatch repair protein MutS2
VPFAVTQKTLERLEWPVILSRLRAHARTPGGRARLDVEGSAGFEATAGGVRERLEETGEARDCLAAGERPPLAGVVALEEALARAEKGGILAPRELLDLGSTLAALYGTARFLQERGERAPRLADAAALLGDHRELAGEIEDCIDAAGEVRDDASPALARARREAHQLGTEIQSRLDRTLRNPDIVPALSDSYFTVRNDRYVLPVRADARGKVPGIVHDASGSGTTLFVEPEALVELNNRHKQAELEIEREITRVLRALSRRAAEVAPALAAELDALATIDLAFARAALAEEQDATAPEVGDAGVLWLPLLRHPVLDPSEAVPNDVRLGEEFHVLVVSGPNAGGKTVTMKAAALATLFVRAGLHVPAGPGARVDLFETILADIGDEQSIGENLSTFSAHMANVARIVDAASERALVVLDEIGVGTDPAEGAAIAQAVLEALADAGARTIATTHYGLLKEMADADARFANASVEFDPETLAPTYRLRMGLPGTSSATAVAARMGLRRDVLDRAHAYLDREDRQLDRMLADLATSRAALESEQREARRLREETEATRAEYRHRLERLQQRRDQLYHTMRSDLDRSFRDAHAQIAAVIRDLQRGGRAQDAAHARERLQKLEEAARDAEAEADVADATEPGFAPVDWRTAKPGDPVRVRGGAAGVLRALPDRRGRVAVGVGSSRIMLPMEQVGRGQTPKTPTRKPAAVNVVAAAGSEEDAFEAARRCDLRGLRVDEAIDRLQASLDDAVSGGRVKLVVLHGIGTGALRRAVREHLGTSAYVSRFEPAPADAGGDGATIAILA